MPLPLLDLKTELLTDPLALGYASFVTPIGARDNVHLANILNLKRAVLQIPREPVLTTTLFSVINPLEFSTLTSLQLQELQVILTMPTIDLNDISIRQILQLIFTGKTVTLGNFVQLRNRFASRYEFLTSPGEFVYPESISKALES
jgi:hypothetical protein